VHTPSVLNTSLNLRGEPLCNTLDEVRRSARELKLDYLLVQDASGDEAVLEPVVA
jgi:predicted NodU family carbamoyl transferase